MKLPVARERQPPVELLHIVQQRDAQHPAACTCSRGASARESEGVDHRITLGQSGLEHLLALELENAARESHYVSATTRWNNGFAERMLCRALANTYL
jgi:hypothetical protein